MKIPLSKLKSSYMALALKWQDPVIIEKRPKGVSWMPPWAHQLHSKGYRKKLKSSKTWIKKLCQEIFRFYNKKTSRLPEGKLFRGIKIC